MEFLSHIEKNPPASSPPFMSTTSALDSAASILGFPHDNSASMVNWLQLYHDNMAPNHHPQTGTDGTTGIIISNNGVQQARHSTTFVAPTHDSEATSVTTKALSLASSSAAQTHLGATAKVGKKRSRASRRAPTTLLNTDTSNFRAMVQQFTGIPQPPLQTPLFGGRSLPHLTLLPSQSLPPYYTHRPQQYPSFPFHSALHDASTGPLLVPTCPSQGHLPVVDDVGLNSAAAAAAALFPNPVMSWSERRSGYLI